MGEHTPTAVIDVLPWPLRLLARAALEYPDAVELVRCDGVLLFANPAFVAAFGYTLSELLGQASSALLWSDSQPPAVFEELDARLSRGEVVCTSITSRRKDGSCVEHAVTVMPLKDADGEMQWMLVHRRALSRRSASLGEAIDPAVADSAHEISNPLVWMLEHARGLPSAPTDSRIKELAEGREVIRGTVGELLKLSQRDDERRVSMSMSVLLDRAIVLEQEALKHIQIHREPSSEDLQVFATPGLVEALAYILRDAGLTCPAGAVIKIRARPAQEMTQLWIMDEGSSIAEADLPRVLEPLFCVRPLSNGLGLGLGLPAAERIVRGLGGSLTVANRHRGRGAVATILLQSVNPQHATPTTDKALMRVLIVDDEPRVSRSLVRLLRSHDVTTTGSGAEALEILAEQTFDLIICDLKMPGMTGMALFERLEIEHPEQAARILFTTGGAWAAESQRFIAKHADRIVIKPFNRQQLEQAIARIQD